MWNDEEGWGAVASPDVEGEMWTHFLGGRGGGTPVAHPGRVGLVRLRDPGAGRLPAPGGIGPTDRAVAAAVARASSERLAAAGGALPDGEPVIAVHAVMALAVQDSARLFASRIVGAAVSRPVGGVLEAQLPDQP
jgi:hypothetical protein